MVCGDLVVPFFYTAEFFKHKRLLLYVLYNEKETGYPSCTTPRISFSALIRGSSTSRPQPVHFNL